MAKFDQHTAQSGWSEADHRQRFYDGLDEKVKDTLSYTDLPTGTFLQLREAANKVDTRMHNRANEKHGHGSQLPSQKDPNAMEIAATKVGKPASEAKTRATFIKFMQGKCFGCGSKD
jgi:hypothetical protein